MSLSSAAPFDLILTKDKTMSSTTCNNSLQLPSHVTDPCAARPFNGQGRMHDDPCFKTVEEKQNQATLEYRVRNFYHCGAEPRQTMDIALGQPLTQFRDGLGHVGQNGGMVDTHSALRNGEKGATLTNKRCVQMLETRPHLTVPFMGRGLGDPNTELALKEGSSTFAPRQCNTLSEVSLPHQFVPLVDCIANEIQDPIHIVPEDNKKDWTRGGYPSRQWVHSQTFGKNCPSSS